MYSSPNVLLCRGGWGLDWGLDNERAANALLARLLPAKMPRVVLVPRIFICCRASRDPFSDPCLSPQEPSAKCQARPRDAVQQPCSLNMQHVSCV